MMNDKIRYVKFCIVWSFTGFISDSTQNFALILWLVSRISHHDRKFCIRDFVLQNLALKSCVAHFMLLPAPWNFVLHISCCDTQYKVNGESILIGLPSWCFVEILKFPQIIIIYLFSIHHTNLNITLMLHQTSCTESKSTEVRWSMSAMCKIGVM